MLGLIVVSYEILPDSRIAPYEGLLPLKPLLANPASRLRDQYVFSRNWFRNCGQRHEKETDYTERSFFGTHGAIGGVPWTKGSSTGAIQETHSGVDGFDAFLKNWTPFSDRKVHGNNEGKTSVTPAVDQATSVQVGNWMNANVTQVVRANWSRINNGISNPRFRSVMTR
ncbi:MAG: hypothetical protein O3A63_12145 [Proteobacteria bacterium]|nr:hypothetical protein [Pseudomonadota bacterium]